MDRPVGHWRDASAANGVGVERAWARVPLTQPQRIVLVGIILVTTAGLVAQPMAAAEILIGIAIVLASGHMIFRTTLWLAGLRAMPKAALMRSEAELPLYSIIVPLYREANMAAGLVSALGRLNYPADKLDILVALEADDPETARAFTALGLPPHWRLIVVPDGMPRTKPRACNYALGQARGALVVIYDAEDRPDPDQLRDAVATFDAGGDGLACIQARLFPFNALENVITRLFALDFCQWFDAMLTGLQRLGFPVPLGGTSNHFSGIR